MAIVQQPDSEYSQEVQKWNTPKRQGGYAPDGHEDFPKMMYRAQPNSTFNGKVMCGDPSAAVGDAIGEAFSRSCQIIVQDQEEADRMIKRGWYDTPDLALSGYEQDQKSIADIAAMRHFSDQKMSSSAQEEAKAVDDGTHEHVPSIPAPRKKRGRPRKRVVVPN
jgi:hypothetical protein|tara:strand:- start:723 stop:1214 length:492 start_codon:yes stop_codon:yes gene_type:complete